MQYYFIKMDGMDVIEEGELLKPKHYGEVCDLTEYKELNLNQAAGKKVYNV